MVDIFTDRELFFDAKLANKSEVKRDAFSVTATVERTRISDPSSNPLRAVRISLVLMLLRKA